MVKVKHYWRLFQKFDNDSDYFWLVDSVCLLFEQRPPLSKWRIVKIMWTTLSVLHGFQYLGFLIQTVRCLMRTPLDIVEFTTIINMDIVLGIAVIRGLCLAYHRDDVLKLKQYVNSKLCQRDNTEAFERRAKIYRKINRFVTVFYLLQTLNACVYSMTSGMQEEVFKYPFATDGWLNVMKNVVDICAALLCIPWGGSVFYSPTQFLSLLSVLHTELCIIVNQFKCLFEDVMANFTLLESNEFNKLSRVQKVNFLAELDAKFKDALSHHLEFIRNHQLLKNISSLNFFVFFCASTIIITVNIVLFVLNPSIESMPLQFLSIQFITEIYISCSMFNSLEIQNNRIADYVNGIDWINSLDRPYSPDVQIHSKSIIHNVIILKRQVKSGLNLKAGGIFHLNLRTFTELMKRVYSLVSLLMHVITDKKG